MGNYDELVTALRELPHLLFVQLHGNENVVAEAADAIEQLEKKVAEWQEEACKWNNEYFALRDSMPRWTSVRDSIPEKPGMYIVYLSASMEKDRWKEYGIDYDGSYVTEAFFNDKQKLWEIENDAYNANLDAVDMTDDYAVTHWTAMPQPPKEDEA